MRPNTRATDRTAQTTTTATTDTDSTMTANDDTTTRNRRTARKPTRDDGQPMKMREMDHTPPVEGARRVFERDKEGKPARADGGRKAADDEAAEAEDTDEETTEADDEEFSQTMGEMDHTPPVEGHNRTFERGKSTDVDDE
jgi:hypothetical protein